MALAKTPNRSALDYLPSRRSLPALREAAAGCKGCDLYRAATQTVFGEGASRARIMFVGEQPGDVEDQQGRPFVGPAGKVLDRALAEAGIERSSTYVTNAVKHFSFEMRGKARLHKRPRVGEVRACVPWLHSEIDAVHPEAIVLLGATAAQAVFGFDFKLLKQRGRPLESELARLVVATIHPSAVLRARDSEGRASAYAMLLEDLRLVARHLESPTSDATQPDSGAAEDAKDAKKKSSTRPAKHGKTSNDRSAPGEQKMPGRARVPRAASP